MSSDRVEEDLGRVLRGLGEVELPAGLQGRVLARARQGERPPDMHWVPSRAMVVAAVCTVVVAVLAGIGVRERHALAPVLSSHASVAGQVSRESKPAETSSGLSVAGSRWRQGASEAARRVGSRRLEAVDAERASRVANPEEARALAEMLAPSMPETPAPLTRQERLLLEVARTREAPALAAESLTAHAAAEQKDEQLQEQVAVLGTELSRDLRLGGAEVSE